MTITTLPTAPARSQAPATFIANADALVAALPTMVTEINTTTAALTSLAAGGAMTIPYTFSTTTTDSDPGNGFLRLDNATQNAATTIRTDLLGADANTWTTVLDTFDDSTSIVKGYIRLAKITDATKFLIFSITSIASPAGYRNITVVNVASSAANPFANNDSIALHFSRTGDLGATGSTGATGSSGMSAPLAVLTPTAAATVDALTTFSSTYDNYLILGQGILPAADDSLLLRLATAGSTDTGSNYYNGSVENTAFTSSATSITLSSTTNVVSAGKGISFSIRIQNANDATNLKAVFIETVWEDVTTPSFKFRERGMVYLAANTVSGIRLFWSGGSNFSAVGKIRIYGYNNT
jgi:hypothetical protein